MTRSFTAIAQGHREQTVSFHLFGPALFIVLAGIVLHIAVELATQKRHSTAYTHFVNRSSFQPVSLCTYLGCYFVRLFWLGYPDEF